METGENVCTDNNQKSQRQSNVPYGNDLSCGIVGFKPRWLQLCNNIKMFLVIYVLLGIFKGTAQSYFGAVLPSMERRFGFSSTSIGIARTMRDVSEILVALLIGHFGGAGHRPGWIAVGSGIVGMGLLLMAATEMIFPVTPESLTATTVLHTVKLDKLCMPDNTTAMVPMTNTTCGKKSALHNKSIHDGALAVLGVAEFLIGLGIATNVILGTPFVDDNVKSSYAPMYYVVSFSGHIFGPLLGLGLAAVFNNIFFDFSKSSLQPSDPRWISAWFLGFIVGGVGTCVFAAVLGCFPSAFPRKSGKNKCKETFDNSQSLDQNEQRSQSPKQVPVTLADLPKNLLRLGRNTTYLLKLCSQLINGFVLSGFLQFGQKFMKEQYQMPQSTVNIQGGLPPVFGGFIGIIFGGFVIKRFQLMPRHVCYLMALSSFVGASCYFATIGLGCNRPLIVGIDDVSNPYNISDSDLCAVDQDCRCEDFEFDPVCDFSTRTTIVSSCVAGCKSAQKVNDSIYFMECSCTGNNTHASQSYVRPYRRHRYNKPHYVSSVREGICPVKCPNFVIYVALMSVAKLAMGIPMAGMLMLQFRIVDYDLKGLANSVSSLLLTLFGFLPAPIIFGKLIDSACHLWQTDKCGVQGACWLYNADDFRWKLHAGIGICRVINLIVDLIIAYRVRHLTFSWDKDGKEHEPKRSSEAAVMTFGDEAKKAIELENKGKSKLWNQTKL